MTRPPDPDLPEYGSVPPQDPMWSAAPPPTYYAQPYPTPPAGYSQPPQKDRAPDIALSWVLYVFQVLGSIAMAFIALFAYMIDAYCSGGPERSCVDDSTGPTVTSYWTALLVLGVGTLIGLIVATSSKRPVWPYAVGGFVLTVIATVVCFAILAS